jgi:hypothetical protein
VRGPGQAFKRIFLQGGLLIEQVGDT